MKLYREQTTNPPNTFSSFSFFPNSQFPSPKFVISPFFLFLFTLSVDVVNQNKNWIFLKEKKMNHKAGGQNRTSRENQITNVANVNAHHSQRLWLTLPKSASFLDLLAQNDAAVERCGFVVFLTSPEYTNSDCRPPFWFQCRFGLALTNGLKQKANPETFFTCAVVRVRLTAGTAAVGVLRHSSVESPLPHGDRSQSSSDSVSLAGDIPRFDVRQALRPLAVESSA